MRHNKIKKCFNDLKYPVFKNKDAFSNVVFWKTSSLREHKNFKQNDPG